MSQGEKPKTSWWQTLPGILTALAGILTALTGLIVALNQIGVFSSHGPTQSKNQVDLRQALSDETSKQSDNVSSQKEADSVPSNPSSKQELNTGIRFHDRFERPKLGEGYEILNPDPSRFILSNKRVIVSAAGVAEGSVPKNLVLLQQRFDADFLATIRLTMQVTKGNTVGLFYWIDSRNKLILGIHGIRHTPNYTVGRHVGFTKTVNNESNTIWHFGIHREGFLLGSVGSRRLEGYATQPEVWYLQFERRGVKYTARVSIEGKEWQEVGSHMLVDSDGRIGFTALSDKWGDENPAEFDDFMVQTIP